MCNDILSSQCSICLELLFQDKSGKIGVTSPCGHCFHQHCYDTWTTHSINIGHELNGTKCPNCNTYTQRFVALYLNDSLSSHYIKTDIERQDITTLTSVEDTTEISFNNPKNNINNLLINQCDTQSLQKRPQKSIGSIDKMTIRYNSMKKKIIETKAKFHLLHLKEQQIQRKLQEVLVNYNILECQKDRINEELISKKSEIKNYINLNLKLRDQLNNYEKEFTERTQQTDISNN